MPEPIDTRRCATVTVYRRRTLARNQRWGWRMVAANGRTIATSGEGYANKREAVDMAYAVTSGDHDTVTTIET